MESIGEVLLITRTELVAIGLPTNKAPEPNGDPDVILRRLLEKKPNIILGTLNKCFVRGHLPETWKETKLVLLQKDNKPLDQPYLINTIGKLVESVIKGRLEIHLDQISWISNRKFGFRKGRSITDAIEMAMDVANRAGTGPLYKR